MLAMLEEATATTVALKTSLSLPENHIISLIQRSSL